MDVVVVLFVHSPCIHGDTYPTCCFGTIGGCFWGVELAFQRVPGVLKTSVGYTAGHDQSPTYNSVCSGQTGHTEAVQVTFHQSCTFRPRCAYGLS